MSIEALFRPDIIVPAVVFAAPVGLYWLKRHYALLEKQISDPALPAFQDRLLLLEAENTELKARVRGLEKQVNSLEAGPTRKALPAAPADGALSKPTR